MMIDFAVIYPFLKTGLTISIALVWFINGLLCKVLNLVSRHRLIVAHILGEKRAVLFTGIIGVSEVLMAAWIVSGFKPELCAVLQIIIVAVMNIIEFIVVPHLLLFGRINILVAAFFIAVVYINAFVSLAL